MRANTFALVKLTSLKIHKGKSVREPKVRLESARPSVSRQPLHDSDKTRPSRYPYTSAVVVAGLTSSASQQPCLIRATLYVRTRIKSRDSAR
jgi:hypothetical protein